MEMWWIGEYADMWKLMLFLAIALVINWQLSYFAGFKRQSPLHNHFFQAVEAVAIGAVASAAVLLVLHRIELSDPLDTVLAKIVIQAVPLSIGASVANVVLLRKEGREGKRSGKPQAAWRETLYDIGATITGAIFLGFSIAPTEEVPKLAAELDYHHEIAVILFSLAVTYGIVFEAEFSPQRPVQDRGPFQHPITETVLCYLVSLVVSFLSLYLLHQINFHDPLHTIVSQTIVLGLPASVGGAAGRLVI